VGSPLGRLGDGKHFVSVLVYFSLSENTTPNIARLFYFPFAIPGGTKERCPLSAEVCDPSKGEGT